MNTVRWGIVGTGRMAAIMATEIERMRPDGHRLTAVASRHHETGRAFADRHRIANVWGCAGDLAADKDVDAVYIATPHVAHADDMLACVRSGKAVLCEKPFTLDAAAAERVIDAARTRGVFVMEAMWTRFLPAVAALRGLLATNEIGPVRMLVAGGAFVPELPSGHYLLDRSLGGGVLLDAGVYLVSLASMILGAPTAVHATGRIGAHGVDEQDTVILQHGDGSDAVLYVSLRARRSPDLEVLGSRGRIRVGAPVFRPEQLTVWTPSRAESVQQYPVAGSGYGYQLEAVADALRAGATECALMPLDETLSILRTLDAIRAQIGLTYPGEAR